MQWYEITRIGIKEISNPMPILYVDSGTGYGIFPSWLCVSAANVHSDLWDCVEFYAIHMIFARRLKITFTSNLKLIKSILVLLCNPFFPSLDSHFSQVRISMLLFLFLLCCIPSLGKKAYGTIVMQVSILQPSHTWCVHVLMRLNLPTSHWVVPNYPHRSQQCVKASLNDAQIFWSC